MFRLDAEADTQQEYISRKGYLLKDLARSFLQALNEQGTTATGKILHYTADIVCSGGISLWQRLCWDYAFDHVGVASPRIFLYLQKRFKEMNEWNAKLPFEVFCGRPEIQRQLSETVLVLQGCSKKARIKMPTIPSDTHDNDIWLRSNLRATDRVAVRRVWSHSHDLPQLLHGANEMVQACMDGATERALFWAKWMMEEDSLMRKRYGAGLTTMERGPAMLGAKQRTAPGFYICAVLAEVYKEFAAKGLIRMHEEFQGLLDLYRATDSRITPRRKTDCLILMISILTDVPRWRVPAAPTLVQDQVVLSRAVGQSEIFFREILALPLPPKPLPAKVGNLSTKKKADSKKLNTENQLDAMDALIFDFYNKF
jgi:hypothetical protein